MSNRNRTQTSPPMSPNERIRRLWPDFKQSVSKSRVLLEHKVEALLDKTEKEYEKTASDRRRSIDLHNAHKAQLAKGIREPHFKSLRRQWEVKLQEVGLRMEAWTDMSNEEIASVLDVLGNPEDEPEEAVVPPERPHVPPKQTFSSASLASYVTSPPQPLAPSLSSSTRSTNISTNSSYAFVDPSEFHSEEEDATFFFPVATSYDLTSDDDDRPAPPRRQNGFDAWSSDSSSHHSYDGPLTARLPPSAVPSNGGRKMTSAGKQAASLKAKEEIVPKPRQSYVGPIVSDPDEPLSEEAEFERFKMHIRFQKIIEFHQAAAHADIELAIAIYKDRMAQNSDKHEVSSKVTNHQKRMMQLQMEKEEERKNIVKAERSKRRSELRRRSGRSGTVVAPRPSVPSNPSWLNAFHEQVADEVESNIVLDKILSTDPDEQDGNVEKLLERLLPGSSSVHEDRYNHLAPAISQGEYPSTGPNGWSMPTSLPRPTDVNHEPSSVNLPKRLSNGRFTKQNNARVARPSPFGEDPESSDEEEDSPSPPASANLPPPPPPPPPPQQTNPFMDAEADSMMARHFMADPELYSYFNQWGTTGELPGVPNPTNAWGMSQTPQTPTVDNPDPWKTKDVCSTPVATRRKSSFSASLNTTPTQNPYNAFMAEQSGMSMSLATRAVLNAANANVREKQPLVVEERRPALVSPPQPAPAPAASVSAPPPSSTSQSSTSPITPQARTDPNPLAGKKPGKKQRHTMKKAGAGVSSSIEDSTQSPEFPSPAETTTPMATIFEKTPPPSTKPNPQAEANLNGGVTRGRKDSTSGWGELLSTPRPASNVPAHLLEKGPSTQPGANKPVEQFRSTSGMSTIKAPPRGSALKNATRSAWSIFSSGDPGPSKPQTEAPPPSGSRDPWLPGGFDVDDRGGQDDQMVNEASFLAQFMGAAPPAHNKLSTPMPVAQPASRTNDMPPLNASSSKAVPNTVSQLPPALSAAGKRGKSRKGKGKKVTVEEVPEEDDQDSRGDRLPVDHRYVMESKTILEPRPSVPPRMYDSIIGFGDDDDGESTNTSSSFASAADTPPSPPLDLFEGDPARFAAAMQEIQEASARMEKKFTGTPSWGVGNGNGVKTKTSEPETSAPIFTWGQSVATDKKRGVMSNGIGNNNSAVPKPAMFAPAIQNLKRSKAPSGL